MAAPSDRQAHAQRLSEQLREVDIAAQARRAEREATVEGAIDGLYLVFESFPGVGLALQSLESQRRGLQPELVSVHEVETPTGPVEQATVFVPDGKLGHFLSKLEGYAETTNDAKPKNANLVDRIAAVRLASVEALWTDPPEQFPEPDARVWWEVWLRRRDGNEIGRLQQFAERARVRMGPRTLGFSDRTVVLVEATARDLATALDVLDDLAELRQPHELAQQIASEPASEQREWVDQLVDRTSAASAEAPTVCILDTGVHKNHALLEHSLDLTDCHSCDPNWRLDDHGGHGTEMAGLALYGDLGKVIRSAGPVKLRHRLESVKLVPSPPQAHPPELHGAVTATAASLVEVQAPARRRVFSMAVTAKGGPVREDGSRRRVTGEPTSWSAAVDALAAGRSIDVTDNGLVYLDQAEEAARRLFLISAGNVERTKFQQDYLTRNDVEPVEDPGQAWNALTVGAYTSLDNLASAGQMWDGWIPLAPRGELSPHSRTSVPFSRRWPVKPDIVLEGGNVACSPAGTSYDTPEALQVLTTRHPGVDARLLTTTCATSAATAQAAHLAASILADYPTLWPETVRALIVHSAEWTTAMQQRVDRARRVGKAAVHQLHRRYGMGLPSLDRATRSASDALTLIVQDTIHPYRDGTMREMHLHDLPWPTDVLTGLGAAQVRMRVTLSYFIEPNPGRRGWQRRYSYASHGLRFDIRRPTESTDLFRKRINQRALAEEERRPSSTNDAKQWIFGSNQRTAGSLHTDIWEGSAADLAGCGAIAIFPVTGWWKENPKRDGSDSGARYALAVSIETPEQDVDIWTPVAQQIGVPVAIQV
ncbi:S8 family peptidase [Verrucosispora sp. WMMD573]|uniref:S8 family peptidase n=1 Tax=Verrucosispora sp. WMMD573 TaxID=3015149 RepID=UPI00248A9ABB|nr:S8 family peptidase [Verrucosispora sp. WMMD573]WBB56289.1 S8 family peptidase [Verrucosispora sp. WMMD573]